MRLAMYRGKWAAVWYENGEVRRRSFGTTDRAAAEVALDRLERAVMGSASTVDEALRAYIAHLGVTKPHPTYFSARTVAQRLGTYGLDDISPKVCVEYAKWRRGAGIKDGSIIKELGVCRAALNYVKPKNGSVFKFPAPPPARDRRLTQYEFDKLVAGAGSPHFQLYLELAAATGARNGALLELTWRQIDFDHGIIDLGEGCGNKGRAVVPMTARLREKLVAARADAKHDLNARVVAYAGRGVASIKKAFARAAQRAGLADVSPHVIRHSVACWLAEGGVPMPEIAAYLGHKDSRVTERVYAKYSPTYLRRAAAVLDKEVLPVQIEHTPVPALPRVPMPTQELVRSNTSSPNS